MIAVAAYQLLYPPCLIYSPPPFINFDVWIWTLHFMKRAAAGLEPRPAW